MEEEDVFTHHSWPWIPELNPSELNTWVRTDSDRKVVMCPEKGSFATVVANVPAKCPFMVSFVMPEPAGKFKGCMVVVLGTIRFHVHPFQVLLMPD